MSSSDSDEETERYNPRPQRENRVAKKSTATSSSSAPKYNSRRLNKIDVANLLAKDRFIENFNPETSVREKRKLSRKFNPPSNVRKPPGALYDENGVHIATGMNLCDCLNEQCVGCFFECPKCGSTKCGIDCRVHRRFMYDLIEYHGYDIVIKNPLAKH